MPSQLLSRGTAEQADDMSGHLRSDSDDVERNQDKKKQRIRISLGDVAGIERQPESGNEVFHVTKCDVRVIDRVG